MPVDYNAEILTTLRAEASAALQHGQDSKRRNEQFLAIAGAGAIALITIAIEKQSPIPFLILPNVLCFIAAYTQRVTAEVILFGLYRKHLEEEINVRLKADILLWEHGVVALEHARLRFGHLTIIFNGGLFGIFIIVAGIVGGFKAHEAYSHSPAVQFAYAVLTVLGIVSVVVSYVECNSVFSRAPVAIEHALKKSASLRENRAKQAKQIRK